jgi:hypothetical protein
MFDPEHHLNDGLAVFAQAWKAEFRRYWALDADAPPDGVDLEDWRYRKALSVLATRFVASAKSLDPDEGDQVELIRIFREYVGDDLTENRFMLQCIEVELAEDLEDDLWARSRRTFELLAFLTRVRSERVRAYLQRVSECYIRGLATETVVICGAVLDVALQDVVSDVSVRESGIRCGRHVSLGNRIDFLERTGVFTSEQAEEAFQLAHERNKAIHAAPELTSSVFDHVARLADLLKALPDAQPPSSASFN